MRRTSKQYKKVRHELLFNPERQTQLERWLHETWNERHIYCPFRFECCVTICHVLFPAITDPIGVRRCPCGVYGVKTVTRVAKRLLLPLKLMKDY
jgi:hypothetical protein